jgi:hypothetical protein
VSPAVGIALFLAIALVLAIVLGAIAAAIVTGQTNPPKATVFVGSCQTPDGNAVVKLQHNGGEVIDADRLRLRYQNVRWRYVPERGPNAALTGTVSGTVDFTGDRLEPGDRVLLGHTVAELGLSDATVQLVWDDRESGLVLARWHGSDGAFNGAGTGHCPFPPRSTMNTRAYNVSMGECEWTPGADDSGHGNQCSTDDDVDNPGQS